MSDKKTRTVSLDKENDQFLADADNASKLVNDLVSEYRRNGDKGTVALELQKRQKERDLGLIEDKREKLEQDIEEIETLIAGMNAEGNAELSKAREALKDTPRDPSNPAVKNWADKLGMRPEELIGELG